MEYNKKKYVAHGANCVRILVYLDFFIIINPNNNSDFDNNDPNSKYLYDWDSSYMKSFYDIMDWYKGHNVPVLTGLSSWNHSTIDSWKKSYESENFTTILIDLLGHLVNAKQYTNI